MQIDTEHLHFWMNAIRESNNPMRTLDAFWSGQMKSKEWLIDNLEPFVTKPSRIEIHGGWVGVLASMIFQSKIPARYIASVDIDPLCEHVATMMNKIEEQDGKFRAITGDMCTVPVHGDIIINTSCEHITQEQYDLWLARLPKDSIVVLQSNDYAIAEHIRIAKTLEEFKEQSHLTEVWSGMLKTQLYTRWMIIGKIKGNDNVFLN
jgi:hypothetical protein